MFYQKINTLFKRDVNNIIIPSEYTLPEFYYLRDNVWECTEKIDGTNTRIIFQQDESGATLTFGGRTERANMPTHLVEKLQKMFSVDKLKEVFPDASQVILFGEGYGRKIQKGGGRYLSNDVNFILFDVKVGDWWLNRASCESIAEQLGISIVPFIGYKTIPEAIDYVKKGFTSLIAEDTSLTAEGLVLKTPDGLRLRNGERLITKIKYEDFVKFANKYGADYTGPQEPNPHY